MKYNYNAEIALLIENDSLKIQKASTDNEYNHQHKDIVILLKDFSNSIIKGTRDGIERVSLTSQVQGLQAQKEALRQLLHTNTISTIRTQIQNQRTASRFSTW